MSKNLVPLDDLPEQAQATVRPGTQAFSDYAEMLEQQHKLAPGSLSLAQFELSPETNGGATLLAAARDLAKQKPAKSGVDLIPTGPAGGYPKGPAPTNLTMYDPTEGGGTLKVGPWDTGVKTSQGVQRFLAGAGQGLAATGRGISQMLGRTSQEEADDAARRDAPLLQTTEGFAGNVGSQMAMGALPRKMAGAAGATHPVTNAAVSSAAMGALQPVATGQTRLANTAWSGAAGAAGAGATQAVGAVMAPAWQNAKPAVQDLAQRAAKHGIPLRAADMSDNPVTRGLTKITDMLPFSGGNDLKFKQQNLYNKALARTMGESSDDLNEALALAKPRLGAVYDQLAQRNTALLTNHDLKQLDDAWQAFNKRDISPNKQQSAALQGYLTDVILTNTQPHAATNTLALNGVLYKELRSAARVDAQSAAQRGDGALAAFFSRVKETLDGSMRRSASPGDAALYKMTDKQYGNMRTLEKLAPKDANGSADFTRLASVMNRGGAGNLTNRNAMIYGQGDQTLPELARIGTTFLGRGAAPTQWGRWADQAAQMAPAATGTGALVGAYSMTHDDEHPVWKGLGAAGAAMLASKGLGSAMNSRWLAQGAPRAAAAWGATAGAMPGAATSAYIRSKMNSVPPAEPGEPADGSFSAGMRGLPVPDDDIPDWLR